MGARGFHIRHSYLFLKKSSKNCVHFPSEHNCFFPYESVSAQHLQSRKKRMNSRYALKKRRKRNKTWCTYITTARHEKSAILHAISIPNRSNKCTGMISPHCRIYAFWGFVITCNSAQSELLCCGCISEDIPLKSVLIPNGFCTSDFLTNYVVNSSFSYSCHMLYTSVSEPCETAAR